jgi:hypothetical protein
MGNLIAFCNINKSEILTVTERFKSFLESFQIICAHWLSSIDHVTAYEVNTNEERQSNMKKKE